MSKKKEEKIDLNRFLRKNSSNMRLPKNWESWTKFWKTGGKVFLLKKPAGSEA